MADKYVDFSATNDGDGTAYTQAASGGAAGAWNTLVGKTPTAGDKVWCRRVTKSGQTSSWTPFVAGVDYIGWPKSGDPFYASRPDGGAHAAWDGDADDYATIAFTTHTVSLNITVAILSLHRFKVTANSTLYTNGIISISQATSAAVEIWNCYGSVTGVGTGSVGVWRIAGRAHLYNCIGEGGRGKSDKFGTFFGYNFKFTSTPNVDRSTAHNLLARGTQSLLYSIQIEQGNYLVLSNCTVEDNPTIGIYGVANGLRLINPTINAQTGYLASGAAYPVIATGMKFVNCDKLIDVNAGVHFLHVKEATQDSAANPAISFKPSFGMLWLDDAVAFHASNTDDLTTNEGQGYIFTRGHSEITNRTLTSGQFIPGQWGSDFAGVLGEWALRSASHDADGNTDVTRDGGGPVGIKVASKATYTRPGYDLFLPAFPTQETIYVALTAGSQTLTLYGAHKGYAVAPTKLHVWFEFDYLDEAASSVSRAWASTLEDAALESDSSTWTGDTGLTMFKISKTVTVGQDCVAAIRIGAGKYEASAYIYIDPKIEVS